MASWAWFLGCCFLKGEVLWSWISFLPRRRKGTWNLGHCGFCFSLMLGVLWFSSRALEEGAECKAAFPSFHVSICGNSWGAWGLGSLGTNGS